MVPVTCSATLIWVQNRHGFTREPWPTTTSKQRNCSTPTKIRRRAWCAPNCRRRCSDGHCRGSLDVLNNKCRCAIQRCHWPVPRLGWRWHNVLSRAVRDTAIASWLNSTTSACALAIHGCCWRLLRLGWRWRCTHQRVLTHCRETSGAGAMHSLFSPMNLTGDTTCRARELLGADSDDGPPGSSQVFSSLELSEAELRWVSALKATYQKALITSRPVILAVCEMVIRCNVRSRPAKLK